MVIEAEIEQRIQQIVKEAKTKSKSFAVRASHALRNSALNVLRGQRSGRRYRVPGTKVSYTASAPGEPPARRTGTLRMSWGISAVSESGGRYTTGIYTDVPYAPLLDEGTPGDKIAPRPFKEKIVEKSKPQIGQIAKEVFSELGK